VFPEAAAVARSSPGHTPPRGPGSQRLDGLSGGFMRHTMHDVLMAGGRAACVAMEAD
jgi:hypothetical protein